MKIKKIKNETKYAELARELKGVWNLKKLNTIPIIVKTLGTIPKNMDKKLGEIGIKGKTDYAIDGDAEIQGKQETNSHEL